MAIGESRSLVLNIRAVRHPLAARFPCRNLCKKATGGRPSGETGRYRPAGRILKVRFPHLTHLSTSSTVHHRRRSLWMFNPEQLREQVTHYDTLPIYQSARGIAAIIILAQTALTAAFPDFFDIDATRTFIWAAAFVVPLTFFIYRGHRWAMVFWLVFFTANRVQQLLHWLILQAWFSFPILHEPQYLFVPPGGSPILVILWWLLSMPFFLRPLQVENSRRSLALARDLTAHH